MHHKGKKTQDKPWEKPGETLKKAEMAMEGNDNRGGDGLVHNTPPPKDDLTDGQTYDEIRNLAPETLPVARQDKKPSVSALLKASVKQPPASRKKRRPAMR